jgi:Concanavalin A-like lectin/glucanases superfamily
VKKTALVLALLAGAVPAWGQNQSRPCLRFRDQVNVELENTRELLDLNGSFTVEMWVWLRSGTQYLVGDESWPGVGEAVNRASGWVLRSRQPGKLEAVFAIPGNDWWTVEGQWPVRIHRWLHVAVVKDDKEVRLYVDGRVCSSRKVGDQKFVYCPSSLFLGVRKNPNQDRAADADMSAFRISDKAIYRKTFRPAKTLAKTEDTLVLLDFSKGEGKRVDDLSGKDHHGDLGGPEWVTGR